MSAPLSRGFALPLAAIAVALIALGLVMTLPTSDLLAREVRHARSRLTLERAAITAETRLGYLLLTEPVGRRGLSIGGVRLAADGNLVASSAIGQRSELVLDGRPYRMWLDDRTTLIVRVQEKSGLINLEDAGAGVLANLWRVCGLPGEEGRMLSERLLAARPRLARPTESRGAVPVGQTLDVLSQLVSGDRRARLNAAISAIPAGTGLHLPTAPAAVVMALFGGNSAQAKAFLDAREGKSNAIKMTALNNQNGYNALPYEVKRENMTGQMRVTFEIDHSKLTIGLPMYFYQSDMEVDMDIPYRSFMAKGPIVHAGRHAQCSEPVGAVIQPLPGSWPPRR